MDGVSLPLISSTNHVWFTGSTSPFADHEMRHVGVDTREVMASLGIARNRKEH
ncbi:hypothetical protein AGABI1DRAFT_134590 [Agaricus bisporus var. burnettii JB137-S8]|uniref:Uncharacterized protein n=1 Tax=Agaricus bisporus var. burnettii (strain JB137-S8 / ATCC MYA-4627 / FGSC 10392) TaxID=597362 RepID=K5WSK9_AGABU|nr:uncharacterized protein AGABI1DRAFT_134590 [Agaricus bisporus var. burnettii JB137-S8]EKM73527.1 hypothetical protein AGABI1DRAFT_134590 [Agaricus bisporus var. burnettii JB137-S8]